MTWLRKRKSLLYRKHKISSKFVSWGAPGITENPSVKSIQQFQTILIHHASVDLNKEIALLPQWIDTISSKLRWKYLIKGVQNFPAYNARKIEINLFRWYASKKLVPAEIERRAVGVWHWRGTDGIGTQVTLLSCQAETELSRCHPISLKPIRECPELNAINLWYEILATIIIFKTNKICTENQCE